MNHLTKCLCIAILFIFYGGSSSAQSIASKSRQVNAQEQWIDSVMKTLSIEQKIGQLFMVAAYTNKDIKHTREIRKLVREYHIGGLIFMQGKPMDQAREANNYQRLARVPLLVSQDAEWGLSMRLKKTMKFPRNMTLGAIRNDSLIYYMGAEVAKQLKQVGVHVNLAPVVDVNNNPENPVINDRSFGENKYRVTRKGLMFSKGLQDKGVLACAKHFPGHGDTDTDSHKDLPIIPHDGVRLDTLELYPFSKMIRGDVGAFMTAHLYIPSLDTTKNLASTLSKKVVSDLLRKRMKYDGLVFTDALNMKGVTKFFKPGEVDLMALKAGNDVLLFSEDVPKAVEMIKEALKRKEITEKEIEEHVVRILRAKFLVGLDDYEEVKYAGLNDVLDSPKARILRKKLYESAITLVKNDDKTIPFRDLAKRKIAYVQVGGASDNQFVETLRKYTQVDAYFLRKGFTSGEREHLMSQLDEYNTVIMGMFDMSKYSSKRFGITKQSVKLSANLRAKGKKVVVSLFGSPYALKYFGEEDAIVVAYEATKDAEVASASALFGGLKISGQLPVTASEQFKEGTGINIAYTTRFGFSLPEEEGLDSEVLNRIDSIAQYHVRNRATPGCAILVIRGNNVVYDKGFGRTEYDYQGLPVDPYETMYDIASITKVAATTAVIMYMVEQKMLSLDMPISTYLPELKGTDKASITIRKLLQHKSGLPAGIAYHLRVKTHNSALYSRKKTKKYPLEVAPNLYAKESISDSTWLRVVRRKVGSSSKVRYSDLSMVILMEIIERKGGRSLEEWSEDLFYAPLGMSKTCFHPNEKGQADWCAPSEYDRYWRKRKIQGFVHDPTAMMMGGCGGNAGLFSNVYDLGKMLLMFKNGGTYGNRYYMSEHTIKNFTKKQINDSPRGLGWDRKETRPGKFCGVSQYSSPSTYGHLGFTGTSAWVDPHYDIVYVCLSNRTYPSASNKKFQREKGRQVMMGQVYKAITSYEKKQRLAKNKIN